MILIHFISFLSHPSFSLLFSLAVGTNANHIVHTFCSTGLYRPPTHCTSTNTPAMDICCPYNVDRILWLLSDGDGDAVTKYMESVTRTGEFQLEERLLVKLKEWVVYSEHVSDVTVRDAIARYDKGFGYLLCPHSALGVYVAEMCRCGNFFKIIFDYFFRS